MSENFDIMNYKLLEARLMPYLVFSSSSLVEFQTHGKQTNQQRNRNSMNVYRFTND